MQKMHNLVVTYDALICLAVSGIPRRQTAVRTLLSCMRNNSRCGLHIGPPKTNEAHAFMAARRTSHQAPTPAFAKGNLAERRLWMAVRKSLVKVQGDERVRIMVSCTYGAPEPGGTVSSILQFDMRTEQKATHSMWNVMATRSTQLASPITVTSTAMLYSKDCPVSPIRSGRQLD